MSLQDFKIIGLNIFAFAMNFSHADLFLKIVLSFVAIGYTGTKWWYLHLDRKNNKKNISKNENEQKED